MIPVGWNSQRDKGNIQQNHGPVQDVMQEKETIPYESYGPVQAVLNSLNLSDALPAANFTLVNVDTVFSAHVSNFTGGPANFPLYHPLDSLTNSPRHSSR